MNNIDYTKYLGIPFKWGGSSVKEGFDCYNLIRVVYKEYGIDLPEYVVINDKQTIATMINESKQMFKKLDKPNPPCIVTFWIRPPLTTHIGVVIEENKFIHIMEKTSVSIEKLSAPEWSKRITGFFVPDF